MDSKDWFQRFFNIIHDTNSDVAVLAQCIQCSGKIKFSKKFRTSSKDDSDGNEDYDDKEVFFTMETDELSNQLDFHPLVIKHHSCSITHCNWLLKIHAGVSEPQSMLGCIYYLRCHK